MTKKEIIEIGDYHHVEMEELGWNDASKSDSHYVALVIGEVGEAIQADRKGRVFYNGELPDEETMRILDDYLSDSDAFMSAFERYCKDTVADELADTFLRVLSLLWLRGGSVESRSSYPSEYYTFTENAAIFFRMISNDEMPIVFRLNRAICFIVHWCDMLHIDLSMACRRKMRYNRLRQDWKSKQKKY